MSDSKSQFSSGVVGQKALSQLDAELKTKLDRASARAAKYHDNWQSINLNDFVDRFAPGSTAKISGSKIIFQADGSNLEVVCDVSAGSCRLKDTSISTSRCYLDINGHSVDNNKTLPNGKKTGRSKAEYNEMTHFRILKREEM